jgi:hypothetical protein
VENACLSGASLALAVPDRAQHLLRTGDLLVGFPPHLRYALQKIGLPLRQTKRSMICFCYLMFHRKASPFLLRRSKERLGRNKVSGRWITCWAADHCGNGPPVPILHDEQGLS